MVPVVASNLSVINVKTLDIFRSSLSLCAVKNRVQFLRFDEVLQNILEKIWLPFYVSLTT